MTIRTHMHTYPYIHINNLYNYIPTFTYRNLDAKYHKTKGKEFNQTNITKESYSNEYILEQILWSGRPFKSKNIYFLSIVNSRDFLINLLESHNQFMKSTSSSNHSHASYTNNHMSQDNITKTYREATQFLQIPEFCLNYRFLEIILGDLYTFSHRNIFISENTKQN